MAPKRSQTSKVSGGGGGVAVIQRQSTRTRSSIISQFPFGVNSESNDSERESERENANNETFAAKPSDGEKKKIETPRNGEEKRRK